MDPSAMRYFTSLDKAQQYATHCTQLYYLRFFLQQNFGKEFTKFDKLMVTPLSEKGAKFLSKILSVSFEEDAGQSVPDETLDLPISLDADAPLSKKEVECLLSAMSVFPETDAVQSAPDEI
jgi:hypothetical protein